MENNDLFNNLNKNQLIAVSDNKHDFQNKFNMNIFKDTIIDCGFDINPVSEDTLLRNLFGLKKDNNYLKAINQESFINGYYNIETDKDNGITTLLDLINNPKFVIDFDYGLFINKATEYLINNNKEGIFYNGPEVLYDPASKFSIKSKKIKDAIKKGAIIKFDDLNRKETFYPSKNNCDNYKTNEVNIKFGSNRNITNIILKNNSFVLIKDNNKYLLCDKKFAEKGTRSSGLFKTLKTQIINLIKNKPPSLSLLQELKKINDNIIIEPKIFTSEHYLSKRLGDSGQAIVSKNLDDSILVTHDKILLSFGIFIQCPFLVLCHPRSLITPKKLSIMINKEKISKDVIIENVKNKIENVISQMNDLSSNNFILNSNYSDIDKSYLHIDSRYQILFQEKERLINEKKQVVDNLLNEMNGIIENINDTSNSISLNGKYSILIKNIMNLNTFLIQYKILFDLKSKVENIRNISNKYQNNEVINIDNLSLNDSINDEIILKELLRDLIELKNIYKVVIPLLEEVNNFFNRNVNTSILNGSNNLKKSEKLLLFKISTRISNTSIKKILTICKSEESRNEKNTRFTQLSMYYDLLQETQLNNEELNTFLSNLKLKEEYIQSGSFLINKINRLISIQIGGNEDNDDIEMTDNNDNGLYYELQEYSVQIMNLLYKLSFCEEETLGALNEYNNYGLLTQQIEYYMKSLNDNGLISEQDDYEEYEELIEDEGEKDIERIIDELKINKNKIDNIDLTFKKETQIMKDTQKLEEIKLMERLIGTTNTQGIIENNKDLFENRLDIYKQLSNVLKHYQSKLYGQDRKRKRDDIVTTSFDRMMNKCELTNKENCALRYVRALLNIYKISKIQEINKNNIIIMNEKKIQENKRMSYDMDSNLDTSLNENQDEKHLMQNKKRKMLIQEKEITQQEPKSFFPYSAPPAVAQQGILPETQSYESQVPGISAPAPITVGGKRKTKKNNKKINRKTLKNKYKKNKTQRKKSNVKYNGKTRKA